MFALNIKRFDDFFASLHRRGIHKQLQFPRYADRIWIFYICRDTTRDCSCVILLQSSAWFLLYVASLKHIFCIPHLTYLPLLGIKFQLNFSLAL